MLAYLNYFSANHITDKYFSRQESAIFLSIQNSCAPTDLKTQLPAQIII